MRSVIFHILIFLALLPGAARAASWCSPPSVPNVTVRTDTDRITWIYTKSEKELNRAEIDTVNPYGDNVITDVGGLMQGGIKMQEYMQFNTLTSRQLGQACMFYDRIDVTFHIFPTVYIAREHPKGGCMHDAIRDHELKHINADRRIVNKYATIVGRAIEAEIKRRNIYGPFPAGSLPAVQAQMKNRMEAILVQHNGAMDAERRRVQQQIDSLPEYERVNHLCDGR